jgi:hypothetical protein
MGGNHHLVNIFLYNKPQTIQRSGKSRFLSLIYYGVCFVLKSSILYSKKYHYSLQSIRKLLTFFKLTSIVFVIVLCVYIRLINVIYNHLCKNKNQIEQANIQFISAKTTQ